MSGLPNLHGRRVLSDQRVVRDQVRLHGPIPVLQTHVDDHLLRPRDAGVVHQDVDPGEDLHRVVVQPLQRRLLADVHAGEDHDALLGLGVADLPQLAGDGRPRLLQSLRISSGQEHASPGDGEVSAQLEADTHAAPGDDDVLTLVKAQ